MKTGTIVRTRLQLEPLEDRWVPVAPVNSIPGSQVLFAGNVLVFSAANGNAVSVSDLDGPGPFGAEVSVRNFATSVNDVGTLSVSNTANLSVTGNGTSDLILLGDLADVNAALDSITYTPQPGFIGAARFILESHDDGAGGLSDTDFVTITVTNPPLTPSVTNATTEEDVQTTSGLVISRNANNGAEVTHFRISNVQNGSLFLANGSTPVANGSFITFADASAGLTFTPRTNFFGSGSFDLQSSVLNNAAGLGGGIATATITVSPIADTPSITNSATEQNTQTTLGLVATRNPGDGAEVTHFQVTGIQNGSVFLSDGTTAVADGSFITVAQGTAGLKFTPAAGFIGTATFDLQASLNNSAAGLGGNIATASITVVGVGSISGTAFDDLDSDGVQDGNEPGVAGRPVLLDIDADGTFEQFATTDANGAYAFPSLLPGTYRVEFPPAPGAVSTTPQAVDTTVVVGGSETINFGSVTPPASVDLFAVGSGPGIVATVEVFNADATIRFILHPFPGFTGGVTVSTGDVNGDLVDDIITGAGPGGAPHVKIFDGATGNEIASFFAYSSSFRSGVFVGLGDVSGDGIADVITGAGAGGGPHVKVLNGPDLALVHSFFAFDSGFLGGVTVRAGDTDGDGFADLVVGAGPGGAPHVKVFSGTDLQVLQSFFAGDPGFTGGVFVGVANLFGDTRFDVVTGVNGRVSVWGNATNALPYIEQDNFTPLGSGKLTGVAAIRQADGIIAILVGAAPGAGSSRVQIVDGTSNTIRRDFFAFGPEFIGGVFVG